MQMHCHTGFALDVSYSQTNNYIDELTDLKQADVTRPNEPFKVTIF